MAAVIFTIAFLVVFLSYVLHTYTHFLEHKRKAVPRILNKYFHQIVRAGYYVWIVMLFLDPVRIYPSFYIRVIGAVVGTIGLYFMLESGRERKASSRNKLITTGVYSLFRNPMYAGMTLIAIAYPISTGSTLTLISAILWISQMALWANWEEKELSERFGQAYLDYRKKVRIWI